MAEKEKHPLNGAVGLRAELLKRAADFDDDAAILTLGIAMCGVIAKKAGGDVYKARHELARMFRLLPKCVDVEMIMFANEKTKQEQSK